MSITELIETATRLREAATPGEWGDRPREDCRLKARIIIADHGNTWVAQELRPADAAFIAHCSTAAMELVEEIARLQAELASHEEWQKEYCEEISGR